MVLALLFHVGQASVAKVVRVVRRDAVAHRLKQRVKQLKRMDYPMYDARARASAWTAIINELTAVIVYAQDRQVRWLAELEHACTCIDYYNCDESTFRSILDAFLTNIIKFLYCCTYQHDVQRVNTARQEQMRAQRVLAPATKQKGKTSEATVAASKGVTHTSSRTGQLQAPQPVELEPNADTYALVAAPPTYEEAVGSSQTNAAADLAHFQRLVQSNRLDEAIDLAAQSPAGSLRTNETIALLKSMDGGKALLQYFQTLLKKGKLNSIESIELSKLVLAKGAIEHIKDWLKEQKLEASEELGDLLRQRDVSVALSVYLRANAPEKVIGCFLVLGAQAADADGAAYYFRSIFTYARQQSYQPQYLLRLQQFARVNSVRAREFALLLLRQANADVDVNDVVDVFLQLGDTTATELILSEHAAHCDRLHQSASAKIPKNVANHHSDDSVHG